MAIQFEGTVLATASKIRHDFARSLAPRTTPRMTTPASPATRKVKTGDGLTPEPRIAVLVPCYNEVLTIGRVVRQFRETLPTAAIYVFDNNSSDGTVAEADRAGAVVFHEQRQGKG